MFLPRWPYLKHAWHIQKALQNSTELLGWGGCACPAVYWWCWYVDGLIILTLQLLAETLLWEASVAVYCIWSPSCPYVNAQLISSYCFCALLCVQVTVQWRLYFSMLLNNVFKKTSHGQTSGTAAFPWTSITWKRCGGKVAPGNCQLKPSQGSSKMAQWVKAQQAEFLGPMRKRERSDSWRMCPSVLSLSLPTSPLWYTHRNKCNVCVWDLFKIHFAGDLCEMLPDLSLVLVFISAISDTPSPHLKDWLCLVSC